MDNFSIHIKENPPKNPLKEIKFDLVHNIIHYKSTQSLQHLALTRVAISLWQHSQKEIVYFFLAHKNLRFPYKGLGKREAIIRQQWLRIEGKILRKVPQLFLPESFNEKLKQVIKLVGNQILQFFAFEEKYETLTSSRLKIYLENICWTFQGTIDKTKTALRLIKHPGLSAREKYVLACNYCLVDEIRSLVQLMPVDMGYDCYMMQFLPVYWFLHFRGNCPEVQRVCSYRSLPRERPDLVAVLKFALLGNNLVAVQYIWEKLANQEMKKKVLSFAFMALFRKNCDAVCFLISQLSKSEEAMLLNNDEGNVFELLLKSQRWSFIFMPFAKYACYTVWNFDNDRVEKLLSFCKKIESKDKMHKSIRAELSEYCQTHSTGRLNERH